VEGTGPVKVQLTGTDFEFVEKVAMAKAGDKKATPKEISFDLSKGKAQGDQENMETEVDTSAWGAGSYRLILTQTNGHRTTLPGDSPSDPTLEGLPLRANVGEPQQTMVLRGTRLEHITRVTLLMRCGSFRP